MLYPPGSQRLRVTLTLTPRAHHCAAMTEEEKKNAYQLAVTFGHITFRGTARVLSILTGPLHRQRAVTAEGVDQAG